MPGYSGTPLAKKLSLKPGMRVWFDAVPDPVLDEIAREGLELERLERPEAPIDAAHIFVTARADMEAKLAALRPLLAPGGFIWVSWPKKASKVPTDLSEDGIRDAILPETDLVDVKVCAVDEIWSGLKLMVRRARRGGYCEQFALSIYPIRMIVCICNAIREADVRQAARDGASCPTSAYRLHGRKPRCGQCLAFAREIIAAERATAYQ